MSAPVWAAAAVGNVRCAVFRYKVSVLPCEKPVHRVLPVLSLVFGNIFSTGQLKRISNYREQPDGRLLLQHEEHFVISVPKNIPSFSEQLENV